MTIQFSIVDKSTDTKNLDEVLQKIKANFIFNTKEYISDKAFDTICEIAKSILIKDKQLNHNTKLIRRILKHNTTNTTPEDIKDTELKLNTLLQNIHLETEIKQAFNIQLNPHMN